MALKVPAKERGVGTPAEVKEDLAFVDKKLEDLEKRLAILEKRKKGFFKKLFRR